MKRAMFFFVVALWAIPAAVPVCRAQTGPGAVDGSEVAYSPNAGHSVDVYGPKVLTDLAGQAIQERRPDVVVVEHYKALRHKVWIEGTTGSGYMDLSPKRVRLMEAASTRGGSVYAALCEEQQRVIQSTVGIRKVSRSVEREYRVETRTYYVRPVYSPPPPPVCVYPATVVYGFGGAYPFYAYGGYGGRPDPHYRGRGGYGYYHGEYGGHYSGSFYRRYW